MSALSRQDGKRPTSHGCSPADQSADAASIGGAHPANGLIVDADSIRAIVVDDDPPVLHLVSRMIVRLGYRCTAAADAIDALFHLNNTYHNLMITDYEMPFMDGLQLAEHIKRLHGSTKVILMTGHCAADLKRRMAGSTYIDGFLFKPFNLNVMRDKIQEVCRFQDSLGLP